ncbi:MAG: DNA topoisomerase IB, partial [Actinomycetota bacterium]|nr:DNA topoisomerase IB [Actinomycetota bacterium]
MARLRRADCSAPGITRRRRGRGFEYFDQAGRKIVDPQGLQRLRDLTVPPAWSDVWICPWPNGHLQAVGIDAAGRKQYLYHPAWRARRDAEKFDRMLAFARALPPLRGACARHLSATSELTRQRVLACAVRLLDQGFFRIGGEAYADNGSYGLATMRKQHVSVTGELIVFEYVGKGGKERVQHLVDPAVSDLVARLKRRRTGGEELLAYKADGRWVDVTSHDINRFIKDQTGGDFSAKDFRTWNATVLAAVAVAVSGQAARSKTARRRAVTRACREVAHYLGNTAAVCRASYIDPRVFDRYRSGWTIAGVLSELGGDAAFGTPSIQGRVEEA